MRNSATIHLIVFFAIASTATGQGTQTVDNHLLPTGRTIAPAGDVISFYGRPVDMVIHNNVLFVKTHKSLMAVDIQEFKILASAEIEDGASLFGIECDRDGKIYVSNSKNKIHIYEFENRKIKHNRSLTLPLDGFPCGMELSPDQTSIYVCLSKKNSVAIVDIETGQSEQIDVGIAPFDCCLLEDHLIVSNLGGRRPNSDDPTANSAGSKTVVDGRGIASSGTISIVDLENRKVEDEINSGLHPTIIDCDKHAAYICNTNEDSVSILKKNDVTCQAFNVKPNDQLPFGSMPNCIQLLGDKVLVALAGNNAIAVFEKNKKPILQGHIPTAWYPGCIAADKNHLFVGSTKGFGARAKRRPVAKGLNSHDHRGTIQRIKLSDLDDANQLNAWTKEVSKHSKLPQIVRNRLLEKQNDDIPAKPIPEKFGQPSVFKHVIYVIKENRTFDQIFGDYKEARSDKNLCIFPRDKTPNHHALADRFGILDNYYCNGVLSADGHSWATEGNVTPYLERAFGGFSRSYTFGDDPLTYSSSGFIWDQILAAGLSFRNYGEMNYSKLPEGMDYHSILKKHRSGEKINFGHEIGIERLKKYSCLDYPGWNMEIPDVLRMDRFLKEFEQFKSDGGLPNFCILYLPEDHLGAKNVTSNAHMADNDLALGRLVQAISNSQYWKDTVIFINEDDPQNGFDHIDGHRSICLVVSAYSKPGVNHNFYNQTSVLRTMLHIFAIPPMNQQDASSPLMRECFSEVANVETYTALRPSTPLDEKPNKQSAWSPEEHKWRQILNTVPIQRTGMKTEEDEDNLNRFIWHETKGWETPYPIKFTGAHATGLQRLGLTLNPESQD